VATATVTSKGQITIPKEIRRFLKIRPGDSVDFFVESDGRVVMKQATLDIEE
jgi:antitoxin PrlF